jgi:hypothetical protein
MIHARVAAPGSTSDAAGCTDEARPSRFITCADKKKPHGYQSGGSMERKDHWERVSATKAERDVSTTQAFQYSRFVRNPEADS